MSLGYSPDTRLKPTGSFRLDVWRLECDSNHTLQAEFLTVWNFFSKSVMCHNCVCVLCIDTLFFGVVGWHAVLSVYLKENTDERYRHGRKNVIVKMETAKLITRHAVIVYHHTNLDTHQHLEHTFAATTAHFSSSVHTLSRWCWHCAWEFSVTEFWVAPKFSQS